MFLMECPTPQTDAHHSLGLPTWVMSAAELYWASPRGVISERVRFPTWRNASYHDAQPVPHPVL